MNLTDYISPMLSHDDLINKLLTLPNIDVNTNDLLKLNSIYDFYYPIPIANEVYCKLYLSLIRSLNKKENILTVKQQNINGNKQLLTEFNSVLGGADCFSITGSPGVGKSRTINKIVSIISNNRLITVDCPFIQVIPFLTIQTPFDSSVKNLLLSILYKIDKQLNTSYYVSAINSRATTDILVNSVANACINHVGVLIIDEIQNLVNKHHSESLINCLTQLINNSGISIVFVGTPDSLTFLDEAEHLARRSIGLTFNKLQYDDVFVDFLKTIWQYQIANNKVVLTQNIIDWFYEHSDGTISTIIALFHDAQEVALTNGTTLDIATLNITFNQRFNTMKKYISNTIKKTSNSKEKDIYHLQTIESNFEENLISNILIKSKNENLDYLTLLSKCITITEVKI